MRHNNRYLTDQLRADAEDLMCVLPSARARTVQRLLFLASLVPKPAREAFCSKCGDPRRPSSKHGLCSPCYLSDRTAKARPLRNACPDCGKMKTAVSLRCRECSDVFKKEQKC